MATEEKMINNLPGNDNLVKMVNFAFAKFFAKWHVAEEERKILEHELRDLEKTLKLKKIKLIINNQK